MRSKRLNYAFEFWRDYHKTQQGNTTAARQRHLSSYNLSFGNISFWRSRITCWSVQHTNFYRGFWKSLAPAWTVRTISPRGRQFAMLGMQVSTVTARISNTLLIKSVLVARLANRHSCVTAGAQIASKCCSWLHPTELIIYQRGAPVLTFSNPPSSQRAMVSFFHPWEWKEEKSDSKYWCNEEKKAKPKFQHRRLSAFTAQATCFETWQPGCSARSHPSFIIPVLAAGVNRKHSAVLIVDGELYIQLSSSGASLWRTSFSLA